MFAKEIILKEQLAVPCLFQCSVDGKLPANFGVGLLKVCLVPQNLPSAQSKGSAQPKASEPGIGEEFKIFGWFKKSPAQVSAPKSEK
jgi:hypothetical protein